MFVAIDETGFFRDTSTGKIGIVTITTITDNAWGKFFSFLDSTFPSGWQDVKGNSISNLDRERVLKYIGSHQEIKYSSVVFDLSYGSDDAIKEHKRLQLEKLETSVEKIKDKLKKSYLKDIELLRNQIRNLSLGEYAKFIFITELFVEWARYFQFDYLYTPIKNDHWKLFHIVDMQVKPEKFKRIVRSFMKLTMNHLNPKAGVYTPAEWGKDHPFIKIYSYEGNPKLQDGNKFFENFKIGNEQEDPQLFLPDIIGNTIYLSITRRGDKKWLKFLKRLKPTRSVALTIVRRNAGYYKVSGFDKTKDPFEVNQEIKEHWKLMKEL